MTAEQLTVRPAERADLGAVERIYAHYVSTTTVSFELTPPDAAAWHERFDRVTEAGLPFLVAELPSDGVAGYAYCSPWKPRPAYRHTVEDSIYVAPWAGRRGVGGQLLGALLDECTAAGVRQVIAVIVDTGDPASIGLHDRHGFVAAGRLTGVGFKHDRWLDTVLLQRSLG
ncbi:MAG TPA: GNAT family N-acetyltransferase [Pseudonocardia sp.]|nr:GNAT family N-acetyltransferase [Pseudonocardia sp.]